jgi:hypothetical protein
MAAPCFITYNAVTSALTAPMAGTATSAVSGTVKTILQLRSPAAGKIRVIEWGYSFLVGPTAPVLVELIETGAVLATVTAGSIANYNDVTGAASTCQAFGFISCAEGTITATRLLSQIHELGTAFKMQYPLGREPEIAANSALRIRATPNTGTATTIFCYIAWEE